MVRERKGDKTRLKEDIDPEVKEKLLTGDIWRPLLDGETDPSWNNEESVHKLWDKHKDFILNELSIWFVRAGGGIKCDGFMGVRREVDVPVRRRIAGHRAQLFLMG